MQLEIKISDFLKTGRFGTVELNDSIGTVVEKLGQPDGEHNSDVIRPRKGIYYSMYEFIFWGDQLQSIQNDHFDSRKPELMEFENEVFKLNPEFLRADRIKRMCDIQSELNGSNIEHDIVDYWGRKAIKTVGDVILDFSDETWSNMERDYVKIQEPMEFELIGLRYHPLKDE